MSIIREKVEKIKEQIGYKYTDTKYYERFKLITWFFLLIDNTELCICGGGNAGFAGKETLMGPLRELLAREYTVIVNEYQNLGTVVGLISVLEKNHHLCLARSVINYP